MGWRIRVNKNKTFSIFSTISDSYILVGATRAEAIDFIAKIWEKDLNTKIKELWENFPIGWMNADRRLITKKTLTNRDKSNIATMLKTYEEKYGKEE